LFEIAGQGHCCFASFLSILVVLPSGDSVFDVGLLTLLGSFAEQDDKALAVFPEVNPVTWAEGDPALMNARADTFTLEKLPCPTRVIAIATWPLPARSGH
jgi:hypothetical protein